MIQYLLISTCDRETSVLQFNTYEEAYTEMQKQYEEAGDAYGEELESYTAYKNDANNGSNYDWLIHTLMIDEEQIYRNQKWTYDLQDACRHIGDYICSKFEGYTCAFDDPIDEDIATDYCIDDYCDEELGEVIYELFEKTEKHEALRRIVEDCANEYERHADCNQDENSTWENVVEETMRFYSKDQLQSIIVDPALKVFYDSDEDLRS